MFRNLLFCVTALFWFGASTEVSVATDTKTSLKDIITTYSAESGSSGNVMGAISRLLTEIDRDGDGLRAWEIDLAEAVFAAKERANLAATRLRFDLDGDLQITRDEIERSVAYQMGRARTYVFSKADQDNILQKVSRRVAEQLVTDKDGDGILRGSEVGAIAPTKKEKSRSDRSATVARALLSADPNSDGVLTEAEILLVLGAALSEKGEAAQ